MRSQRGQSTVEWIALILLVALLLFGLLAVAGKELPGGGYARALVESILCAVDLEEDCGESSALVEAYGEDVATLVRAHVPDLFYEEGMVALPVDYRRCREPGCSDGPGSGEVSRSSAGERVVAFVHAVDCRARAADETEEAGYNCSGRRRGRLYLQYFFYYPTSSTAKALPGDIGFHEDDWESFQVRINAHGADARASSHHGYNYELSKLNWPSDAGGPVGGPARDVIEDLGGRPEGGWGPWTGQLHVSGGSHAGNAKHDNYEWGRKTAGADLTLIPIETLPDSDLDTTFEVVPPWLKPVFTNPESDQT